MRPIRTTPRQDEATPLREFEWNDDIVGIGFFPSEVALPEDWSWPDPPRTAPRVP